MATPEKSKPQPWPWPLVRMLRGIGHAMLVVPCGFFSKAQFPLLFSINADCQHVASAIRALPASLSSSWQSIIPPPATPPVAAGGGGASGGGGGGGEGQAQTSGGLCDGPTADGECGATTNYAGSALCWIKDHFTVQFHHKQRQWRMIPSASHQKRGSHSVRLYRRAFYPTL